MSSTRIKFGVFEFDSTTHSLTQAGHPIGLPAQPAKMLAYLLSRRGQVVSRKELQHHVWGDRIVEFDQGINHCIRQIRTHLGDRADAPRYIETVARLGYRFVGTVVTEHEPRLRSTVRRAVHNPYAALLAVAGMVTVWLIVTRAPTTPWAESTTPIVAVLPLVTHGPDRPFAEAVTEILYGQLVARGGAIVLPPDSVRRRMTTDAVYGSARRQLGKALDADYLVTGNVRRDRPGDPLTPVTFSTRLFRVADGAEIWSGTAETKFDTMAEEMEQASVAVIARIAQAGPHLLSFPGRVRTSEAQAAYAAYQLGNEHLRRRVEQEELALAVQRYRFALDEDSTFAPAWARLAVAHATLASRFGMTTELETARRAAARATRLAPESFDTQLALGALALADGDFQAAQRYLQVAHRLAPLDPEPLISMGDLHQRQGQLDAAATAFEHAFQLDPLAYEAAHGAATTFHQLEAYDAAERYWAWAATVLPTSVPPIIGTAWVVLERDGDTARARQTLSEGEMRSRRDDLLLFDPALTRVLAPQLSARITGR